MRVNLSSMPVLLEAPSTESKFGDAIGFASEHTGVKLYEDVSANSVPTLQSRLDYLFKTARQAGPAQGAAAAVMYSLALSGSIMLPVGKLSFRAIAPSDYAFVFPAFLREVDEYVRAKSPSWLNHDTHMQLLLGTDCREGREFDIDSYAKFHTWLIENDVVESRFSLASAPYVTLRAIEETRSPGFGRDLRHGYILWRASESSERMDFSQFMADPKNLAGMRVHGQERERIELQSHVERRREKQVSRKAKLRAERPHTLFVQNLLDIAASDNDDAPERYFASLTGGSNVKGFRPDAWIESPVNFPGRDGVNVTTLGERWFIAFRAFLVHRQRDYETDKQVRAALHVLADYVLLYLPWWVEKHPGTNLKLPTSPKMLLRYYYVDRTRFHSDDEQSLGDLPKTLNELLPLRRPTPGARNTTRILLQKFFNFVLTYFEDNAEFVNKGMQNPFRTDFDNEVAGRRTKTNKVPFSDDVFPFLIHYGQAAEAFGEFLQQQAYERNVFRELPTGPRDGYETGDWGYVPVFWYRGRLHRVEWLPAMYLVTRRVLKSNPVQPSGIYVQGGRINAGLERNVTLNFPHLTVLRLLTAMVESGLRAQSLQWLDRRNFDKLAPALPALSQLYGNASAQGYHALYINTDKTHEEWNNLVSWRVRRSLLAEKYFQDSVVDPRRDEEVHYEDRENSRFLPILPLFRSDRGVKPVSDGNYSGRWVEFLYGFQHFYNRKDGVDRSGAADALVVLRERDEWEEGASIPNIYLAIHTPHACRATYATLKDGDLEISEIAEQLGHQNTAVTSTYQVPQVKRLVAKLKDIDERVMSSGAYEPAGDGQAYLHPEREDSAVRSAFDKSREHTIANFGFVPGVGLWSLSELDGDASALELLRQSPASVIRWHPTHVCPVGNQCPREVVANTGEMRRCGICPLAAKCVDHLPAIEAKQAELLERITSAGARQRALSQRGAAQDVIDALHHSMQLDTKELLGWKLSAEILRIRQREIGNNPGFQVDQPELVRKQLELVTRNRTESEFFLQRIAEANAYPSLESAEVRAKAARFSRLILARQGRLEEAAFLDVPEHDELRLFASMLRPYVEANNLTLEQVAAAIDEVPRQAQLAAQGPTPLLRRD